MSFLALIGVEFKKIRRCGILFILLAAVVILWLPSILNVHINFEIQDIGISPEDNFMIQGFMGMVWFMFPASMVVSTVLLTQTERGNRGILKMLSLPVSTFRLCMAKFVVLLSLAAVQMLMTVGMYFISAAIVTQTEHYGFVLPPLFVLKEAGILFLVSIPMCAFFWLLSVCISTPIFSIGAGLACIVPSVLMINTKLWFVYPMCYPFYVASSELGRLSANLSATEIKLIPWIPIAVMITLLCLCITCFYFGKSERR